MKPVVPGKLESGPGDRKCLSRVAPILVYLSLVRGYKRVRNVMALGPANAEFIVWGIDYTPYGPVDLPTLVSWVKDQRVTAETWIFVIKEAAWQKAVKVPALQMFFQPKAAFASAIPPNVLRRVKILAGLNDHQLERFVKFTEIEKVPQQSLIAKQGERGDSMQMVLQGELHVRMNISGKETILATLGVGDFFGDVSLFDSGPRYADVVTNTESVLLRISASALDGLAKEAPDVATPFLRAIGRTMSARIRAGNKRYSELVKSSRTALVEAHASAQGYQSAAETTSVLAGDLGEASSEPSRPTPPIVPDLEYQSTPEPTPAVTDPLHFSVSAPRSMQAGQSCLLEVWAHPSRLRDEVRRRAREHAGGLEITLQGKGPLLVKRGTLLTVKLSVSGLHIKHRLETILWEGEVANAQFVITVPATAVPGDTFAGRATIYSGGALLTVVSFILRIAANALPSDLLETNETPSRRAFASYASEDADAVLGRIQGMKKALPDLDVFYARSSLTSGERWRERLREEICARDVFYLFWSQAAQHSEWVNWEWRLALAERGIDYIDPVPLTSPQQVKPPPELADELHFDDWVLAYMNPSDPR